MIVPNRLSTGLWLAGLGFLGFYLFGLIMGVYSATEVPYFTIPAGVVAVAFAIYLARRTTRRRGQRRRGNSRVAPPSRAARVLSWAEPVYVAIGAAIAR